MYISLRAIHAYICRHVGTTLAVVRVPVACVFMAKVVLMSMLVMDVWISETV